MKQQQLLCPLSHSSIILFLCSPLCLLPPLQLPDMSEGEGVRGEREEKEVVQKYAEVKVSVSTQCILPYVYIVMSILIGTLYVHVAM